MIFNVSGLIQDGVGATRRDEIEVTLTLADGREAPVSGSVELLRTVDGVLVRARLQTQEDEVCSRCLKPLQQTIAIEFEEEFRATVDGRSGQPLAAPEPDAFTIDEHHLLDLTEAIRQYREVCVAMQPLCRPDCLGLCPVCGADRNAGDCGHTAGHGDERWSTLAALLDRSDAGVAPGKE